MVQLLMELSLLWRFGRGSGGLCRKSNFRTEDNIPCMAPPVFVESARGARIPVEELASNGHPREVVAKSCGGEEFVRLTFL